ncbi:MAG: S-adenosylmethionine:tRNA ribosyltransferase-isomerase [Acidimicrobiales bacterium]|nr:S-adenosylmethionine:tRNA ribosyltransferase-isomerase [Acidimicrobiales bacterium]
MSATAALPPVPKVVREGERVDPHGSGRRPRLPAPAPPPRRDDVLDFVLPADLEAHEPLEAAGRPRDDVRLLVSRGLDEPIDSRFGFLPAYLQPGDLLVVNTSATIPAALTGRLEDGEEVAVHLSTPLPDGTWLVEVRRQVGGTTEPLGRTVHGERVELAGGGWLEGRTPWRSSNRLTAVDLHLPLPAHGLGGDGLAAAGLVGGVLGGSAAADDAVLLPYLAQHGRPIRYQHVPVPWPIATYQTVFADRPGSAEMPSASRPFTTALVTRLVSAGIGVSPITLHTGVSSLEGHEDPYPERFDVPESTAHRVADAHRDGHRVIAVGTTVVRALESAVDPDGRPVPAAGWTERVVSPAEPPVVVDGLITGWHEPRSSHLRLLEAVAGRPALELAYDRAVAAGYRWHEFGDLHLILPD